MSKKSKVFTIIVYVAIIAVTALITFKTVHSEEYSTDKKEIMQEIAYNLCDINNIRFTGYTPNAQDNIIDRLFTPEIGESIKSNLILNSENKFISYESTFQDLENTIKKALEEKKNNVDGSDFINVTEYDLLNTDERFKTVNNERGLYLSDIENLDNRYIKICGNDIEIDQDTSNYIGSLKDNQYYKFEVVEYYYCETDNILRVKLQTKETALDGFSIEYTCYLDKDNKIKKIDNEALIYSKLLKLE